MTDTPLFNLNADWRLAHDRNQWILQHREGKGWKSVSFIGSTKTLLRRLLTEKGVTPDTEGQAALDALPEKFLDWRRCQNLAPDSAIPGAGHVALAEAA